MLKLYKTRAGRFQVIRNKNDLASDSSPIFAENRAGREDTRRFFINFDLILTTFSKD